MHNSSPLPHPEPVTPSVHSSVNCPNTPQLGYVRDALSRLEKFSERQALAMEEIARNSVLVSKHEKQLDQNSDNTRELFLRMREVEQNKAPLGYVESLEKRIRLIEKEHDIEEGVESALEQKEDDSFWTNVKRMSAPYVLPTAIMIIYVLDKFNIPQNVAKIVKEIKG